MKCFLLLISFLILTPIAGSNDYEMIQTYRDRLASMRKTLANPEKEPVYIQTQNKLQEIEDRIRKQYVVAQEEKKEEKKPQIPSGEPIVKPSVRIPEPTKEESGEHAVCPINMIKNKVENVKVGTSTFVAQEAVKVDAKRKMWINPLSLTGTQNQERIIQVKKESNGYHITIDKSDMQWEAGDLDSAINWIPIRTASVK